MFNKDMINTILNILFGISISGTIITFLLFLAIKVFKLKKLTKLTSIFCLVFSITWVSNIGLNIYLLLTTPPSGIAAVNKGIVKNITPGTPMLKTDQQLSAKNYKIELNTKDSEMNIFIWDYANEDSDCIQVLVDNKPVSNTIELTHKPKVLKIPTKGKIEIKGLKDGDNGINYAMYLSTTKETYFNSTSINSSNVYTISNKKTSNNK
ncbi:hypothetical protein OW763_15300 [Clostridium aestuarii]|uniref:Uncharacterized protein n=1 Tax=Clostridium aestuarii TaxID=338193 RepID=A0ABT4D378_9CLOT|nr:hypothetical protein [Clostridium aestuarii]MCY6485694.1 hypothetical protein [Clostridium aestuarii]